jgi:hypothetical protein
MSGPARTLRDDTMALLHYENFERFPIVHFGFWGETIEKWRAEGHIPTEETTAVWDDSPNERRITERLGFDFNWSGTVSANTGLLPPFEEAVLEELPGGYRKIRSGNGVILRDKPGTVSIPAEIDHVLQDRESWEKEFVPRLAYSDDRVDRATFAPYADDTGRTRPIGYQCGSLYGTFRDWAGLEGTAYLRADDEDLVCEILDSFASMQLQVAETALSTGAKFDFGHFWEDICFRGGPLVDPVFFRSQCGPWYRKFADLLGRHGIDIISLDCDGRIDELVPIWLDNGINTMFPIEVGVWGASIEPWRKKYGKAVRGVGGMDKRVFAQDFAAVDREVERLRRLVDLGGYLPCPDHRIAPDAKWENVRYYTERMRATIR